MHRRFVLNRTEDETGISGVGLVAQGIEFEDGVCVIRWMTEHRSTAMYPSIDTLIHLHGHNGKTRVDWVDGV